MADSPVKDSMWMRCLYEEHEEAKKEGREWVQFKDVEMRVVEWAGLPIEELRKRLE